MKIGRNAPCPCGSGKKYKKCCMVKESNPPTDLLWRRLGDTHERLVKKLLETSRNAFGEMALSEAFAEFMDWPEDINEADFHKELAAFIPWFVYNWENDLDEETFPEDSFEFKTIAEWYLDNQGNRIDRLERQLIEAANRKPFSFYEVMKNNPGKGFRLRDILTRREIEVMEKSASKCAKEGDILFTRVITVDHVSVMIGCGSVVIPPGHKPSIIELRQSMQEDQIEIRHWTQKDPSEIDDDNLIYYDPEIRQLYFEILNKLHSPPEMPTAELKPGKDLPSDEQIEKIKGMIRAFGKAHLDTDLTGYVLELLDRIQAEPTLSLKRGRPEIWAAAMVYVIARLNFLFDRESEYHLTTDTICDFFNTRKSTTGNKATFIEQECGLFHGEEGLCRPEISKVLNLVELPNGMVVSEEWLERLSEEPTASPPDDPDPPGEDNPHLDLNRIWDEKIQPESTEPQQPESPTEKVNSKQLTLFDD